MGAYILRRTLGAIPLLLFVSITVFGLLHLAPGGPTAMYLRRGAGMSGEDLAKLEESLGLNDPVYVQYWRWLENVLQGDFGMAVTSSRTVSAETSIASRYARPDGNRVVGDDIARHPDRNPLRGQAILCLRSHRHHFHLHRPEHPDVLVRPDPAPHLLHDARQPIHRRPDAARRWACAPSARTCKAGRW